MAPFAVIIKEAAFVRTSCKPVGLLCLLKTFLVQVSRTQLDIVLGKDVLLGHRLGVCFFLNSGGKTFTTLWFFPEIYDVYPQLYLTLRVSIRLTISESVVLCGLHLM